jgi:hypothetical protein
MSRPHPEAVASLAGVVSLDVQGRREPVARLGATYVDEPGDDAVPRPF